MNLWRKKTPVPDDWTLCDWCRGMYPSELVCGIEQTPERLCKGCYYCWKHGSPILARDFNPTVTHEPRR